MGIDKLALNIGKATIKIIACCWVNRPDLIADVAIGELDSVFESFTSNAFDTDEMQRKLYNYSSNIGKEISSYLTSLDLQENSRESVANGIFDALNKLSVTQDMFSKINFSVSKLEKVVYESVPNIELDYNGKEKAALKRCANISAVYISNFLPSLPSFQKAAFSAILDRFDGLAEHIEEAIQSAKREIKAYSNAPVGRFENEYRESVLHKYNNVELFTASIDRNIQIYDLSVAYVSLQMKKLDDSQLITMQKAFKVSPVIAISGEAGSGKTTLLQWLAINSAKQTITDDIPQLANVIPFMVTLRTVQNWDDISLNNVVQNVIKNKFLEIPNGWISDVLKNERALILVDGFDEITKSHQEKAIKWLEEILSEYPKTKILMTARPSTKINIKVKTCYVEMRPMSQKQITIYIKYWHKAVVINNACEKEENAQQYIKNLMKQIIENPALARLAKNPLLCAMLCALHYKNNTVLPKNKTELYEECCKMLLEDRNIRRGIEQYGELENRLDYRTKSAILDDLAYWMIRNGTAAVSIISAVSHLKIKLANMCLGQNEEEIIEILNYLVSRSGLIREPEEGKIDFIHKTFEEYMAAREICHQEDWGVLCHHASNSTWRETILLSISFANANNASNLVSKILKLANEKSSKQIYYQLLALLCAESAKEINADVRNEIGELAASLIPPDDCIKAILSEMGDWVIHLLEDKIEYTEAQRINCINTLGMMSSLAAWVEMRTYVENTTSEFVFNAVMHEASNARLNLVKNASFLTPIEMYLIRKKSEQFITISAEAFYLLSECEDTDQNQKKYSFNNITVSNYFDFHYKALNCMFECNSLNLLGDYNSIDILSAFSSVKQLQIIAGSKLNLCQLQKYTCIKELKELIIVLSDNCYVNIAKIPIIKEISRLKFVFTSSSFELLWEDLSVLNKLEELSICVSSLVDWHDWNEFPFNKIFKHCLSISIIIEVNAHEFTSLLCYSSLTEINESNLKRLTFKVYGITEDNKKSIRSKTNFLFSTKVNIVEDATPYPY